MLTENNPNRRMVLVKNPYFHGETYPHEGSYKDNSSGLLKDARKPLPFIDKAIYMLEREKISYWNKFYKATMILLKSLLIVLIRP